ncbi:hypothetical protein Msi02_40280 [Microbispora siamensis]|uniref:Uncharacterized protein n=1 Tax=Microbispora siamensis TaxID=564413 RepID=A0ABQ4GP69_9ACTN|nr:hypothetical protein Msi02_40280 [Microbispora siamensis]
MLVRLDDDAARQAEIAGEVAGGGQAGARDEPPGPDGVPHLAGDLPGEPARGPVDHEMKIGHWSTLTRLDWTMDQDQAVPSIT